VRPGVATSPPGQPLAPIFTGWYAEAAALDILGSADHLPPVLSGHNAYWMWGAGRASDQTVLVVDARGWLRAYFAAAGRSPSTTPVPGPERLDPHPDRRPHRAFGQLARYGPG
jgi:hypothetical protein